jgi:MoaA/NifB/PqqE/SkfB family radical SAM enzyme
MNLSILYRGPLSSCNYACEYCPFAKHTETREELAHDAVCLSRFLNRIEEQTSHSYGILFTPWGEALVRRWYQEALIRLTNFSHIRKAAIQTNLSCKLDWVEDCDRSKLAFWCTFHPAETTIERFLEKCTQLIDHNVRFSVGIVGLKEHADAIAMLRAELPPSVYLWINAYKRESDYYTPEMIARFMQHDPLFPLNNQYHTSHGQSCRAGHTAITIDGEGTIRRCHFIKTVLGNFYDPDWENVLAERPCTNETCGCHIGYVHLDRLNLSEQFGEGLLERIPLGYR